jgi:hypothetical protein
MKTMNSEKICRALALTVCAVGAAVLASCERLNDEGTKTAVHFLVGELEPWGGETLVRGDGGTTTPRVVETARVALENNWVLEADLIEDPAPATRANPKPLAEGAIMRIVARNTSTNVLTESDYVCSGGNFEPVSGAPMVVEAGEYVFTAYSYNTSDGVAATAVPRNSGASVAFSPYDAGTGSVNDLIWGTTAATTVPVLNGISFPTLTHGFSKAKYSWPEVSGVTIGYNPTVSLANNCAAVLNKSTASLARGTANVARALIKDDYRIVYTGVANPVLNISGTINGSAFSTSIAYRSPMVSGKSYTLQVNVRQGVPWAGSNIYWDGEKLTFREANYSGPDAYFQGVYFKWGSLVGISPVDGFSSTTTLYVYDEDQGKWTAPTIAQGESWADIPYNTLAGSNVRTADNLGTAELGDICRFIGLHGGPANYRMPRSDEFELGGDHTVATAYYWVGIPPAAVIGWTSGGAFNGSVPSTMANGQQLYGSDGVAGYAVNCGSVFPAVGRRGYSDGSLSGVGSTGWYWSTSGHTSANAYVWNYGNGGPNAGFIDRQNGLPVRCLLIQSN